LRSRIRNGESNGNGRDQHASEGWECDRHNVASISKLNENTYRILPKADSDRVNER
jgi:hypothetical protein